ncbi:hypothetical protein RL1895 [Rhizobium johnstonii 3841]|uniref:Uncharacterized protein n=1 Tax=Rhizobium johnstonii (strain DSM 114642 / LMG 32736 / 3841) TaxID=216596 RepID=Q1MI21_RHIJ3|nr:hypothetical protein RL1895 [Rhizobium johnstonii 3841]
MPPRIRRNSSPPQEPSRTTSATPPSRFTAPACAMATSRSSPTFRARVRPARMPTARRSPPIGARASVACERVPGARTRSILSSYRRLANNAASLILPSVPTCAWTDLTAEPANKSQTSDGLPIAQSADTK